MELVYLWVEEYKNIHKQGFNFSPKFNCYYDVDSNELTIDENDDYIENFFGKNINVTAIVGKNGSGKSSVLRAIIDYTFEHPANKFIIVYKDNDISYYSNFVVNTSLNKVSNPSSIMKILTYNDMSTCNESYASMEYYETINMLQQYIYNILVSEGGNASQSFKLSTFMYIPDKVKIKLKNKQEISDTLWKYLKREQKKDIQRIFDDISDRDIEHQILFIQYLIEKRSLVNEDILKNLSKLKKAITNNPYSDIVILYSENTFIIDDLTEEQKDLYMKKDGFYEFLEFDLIDKKERKFNNLSYGEKVIFGQLLNLYFYAIHDKNIFLFDEPELGLHPNWQKKYLNEVINLLKKIGNNKHFIVTSHSPFLLSDIPKQNIIFLDTYENGNCKVLKHDDVMAKKQTFGANIHTLLSDSFFMEDGLMGEFAKGKINEIIEFHKIVAKEKHKKCLKKIYNKRKKNLWQTQSIIGEEYLKQVMKNHLVEIEKILLGKDMAKKEEIARTEVYLESLKNA